MKNVKSKDPIVLKQMQDCFKELGYQVIGSEKSRFEYHFGSVVNTDGCIVHMLVTYSPKAGYADLMILRVVMGSAKDEAKLLQTTNHINNDLAVCHFIVYPIPESATVRVVGVRAGLIIIQDSLDKDQFKSLIENTIHTACQYKPLLEKQLQSSAYSKAVMDEFARSHQHLYYPGEPQKT